MGVCKRRRNYNKKSISFRVLNRKLLSIEERLSNLLCELFANEELDKAEKINVACKILKQVREMDEESIFL